MARTEWSERLGGDDVSFCAWVYRGALDLRMTLRGQFVLTSARFDAGRSLAVQARELAGRISARVAG